MLLERPKDHFLDSWALRHLLTQRLCDYQELSALLLSPDRYVARYAVCADSGEESVLTFTLTRNAPASLDQDTAPNPTLLQQHVDGAPMGVRLFSGDDNDDGGSTTSAVAPGEGSALGPVWRLSSVTGEPRFTALPRQPSPEHPPECIVQSQLAALQAYEFAEVRGMHS